MIYIIIDYVQAEVPLILHLACTSLVTTFPIPSSLASDPRKRLRPMYVSPTCSIDLTVYHGDGAENRENRIQRHGLGG